MSHKIKYRIIIIIGLSYGIFINSYYRKLPNSDRTIFGDFISNSGSYLLIVLILCSLLWSFDKQVTKNKVLDTLIITCFYLLSESISYFVPYFGVFDIWDLLAIPLGTGATIFILYLFEKDQLKSFVKTYF